MAGGGAHGQHDPSEPQARPDARPLGLLSERGPQGTYDIDPSWSVNAGAKWTFDKSRASLSVRCNDIFESSLPFAKVRYKGQYLDMDSGTYTRSVTVHFSYRFGTYKEKRHKTVDTSRFGH